MPKRTSTRKPRKPSPPKAFQEDELPRETVNQVWENRIRSRKIAFEHVVDAAAKYFAETLREGGYGHEGRMSQRERQFVLAIDDAHERLHRRYGMQISEDEVRRAETSIRVKRERDEAEAKRAAKQLERDMKSGKIVSLAERRQNGDQEQSS